MDQPALMCMISEWPSARRCIPHSLPDRGVQTLQGLFASGRRYRRAAVPPQRRRRRGVPLGEYLSGGPWQSLHSRLAGTAVPIRQKDTAGTERGHIFVFCAVPDRGHRIIASQAVGRVLYDDRDVLFHSSGDLMNSQTGNFPKRAGPRAQRGSGGLPRHGSSAHALGFQFSRMAARLAIQEREKAALGRYRGCLLEYPKSVPIFYPRFTFSISAKFRGLQSKIWTDTRLRPARRRADGMAEESVELKERPQAAQSFPCYGTNHADEKK